MESASCSIGFSKLNSPAHQYLCLRFKRYLAISPARLEARMDSLSPSLKGSFIPYNMPAYPGALRIADDPGHTSRSSRQEQRGPCFAKSAKRRPLRKVQLD